MGFPNGLGSLIDDGSGLSTGQTSARALQGLGGH